MSQLEFRTQAQAAIDEDDYVEITIADAQGRNPEVYEVLKPTETQIAIYLASYADGNVQMLNATLKFMETIFGEEDAVYLKGRMNERSDPFSLDTLSEIILGLIQEVNGGRPTRRSTGSTSSRRPGGPKLTDHLPPKASTRSRSPRNVSATSSTPGASKE